MCLKFLEKQKKLISPRFSKPSRRWTSVGVFLVNIFSKLRSKSLSHQKIKANFADGMFYVGSRSTSSCTSTARQGTILSVH